MIVTVPSISFVDVQLRRLVHAVVETTTISRRKKEVGVKWFNGSPRPRFDKPFNMYPVDPETGRIKRIWFGMPDKDLITAYEKKKREFATILKDDIEITIKQATIKEAPRVLLTTEEMTSEIIHLDNITIPAIQNKFGIGDTRSRKVKAMWLDQKKKGA